METVKKTLVFLSFFWIFAFHLFPIHAAAPETAADGQRAKALIDESNHVDQEWNKTQDAYEKKLKELIGKMEKELHEDRRLTDNGDAKERDRIRREIHGLQRKRDDLKQKLAEISASKTVAISKIPENLQKKIDDLKE